MAPRAARAAGMLSPVAELECADAGWPSSGCARSRCGRHRWRSWTRRCNSASDGSLLLAHRGDEGAAQRVVELLDRKAPPATRRRPLDAAQLRELEPALQGASARLAAAGRRQIDTVQAMQALQPQAHGRAAGTGRSASTRRARHAASSAVDASASTGCSTCAALAPGPQLPVRGVRGEIFWLHAPGVRLRRPLRLLHPRHRVYLVPRAGDIVVVGASEIESEDRSPVSLRSTVELLAAAHSVLPELAEARIVHSETNLRPALPDNLPRIEIAAGPDAHQRPVPPRLADRAGAGGGRACSGLSASAWIAGRAVQ